MNKSRKDDRKDNKPRWELLPMLDLEDIVKVYTFGAKKYGEETWRELPDGMRRYWAALNRHYLAYLQGELYDNESGLPHLAHCAWNALAMLSIFHDDVKKQTRNNDKKRVHKN